MAKNEEAFYKIITDENIEFGRKLKALDIDVMLYEAKDSDFHIAKYIDKPGMGQHFYVPALTNEWLHHYPSQLHYSTISYGAIKPAGSMHDLDIRHTLGKFIEYTFIYFMAPSILSFVMINEWQIADEVRGDDNYFLTSF